MFGNSGPDGEGLPSFKPAMCRLFQQGRCNYGDKCKYAHNDRGDDFGGRGKPAVVPVPLPGATPQQQLERREAARKTRLCDKWMTTGRCNYNPCIFAHGPEELQSMGAVRHQQHDMREGAGHIMMPNHGHAGVPPGGGVGPLPMMPPIVMGGMMHMPGMAGLSPPINMPGPSPSGLPQPPLGMKPVPPQHPPPHQGHPQLHPHPELPPGPPPLHKGGPPPVAPPPPLQQPAPQQPAGQQHQPGSGAAAARTSGTASASGQQAAAPPPGAPPMMSRPEVSFVDRVRAVCGILNIGSAATLSKGKPAALQAAVMAIKNGSAFRENPFSDDVERYIERPSKQQGV